MFDIINEHKILSIFLIFITRVCLLANKELFKIRKESAFAYIVNDILDIIISLIIALFILEKIY